MTSLPKHRRAQNVNLDDTKLNSKIYFASSYGTMKEFDHGQHSSGHTTDKKYIQVVIARNNYFNDSIINQKELHEVKYRSRDTHFTIHDSFHIHKWTK